MMPDKGHLLSCLSDTLKGRTNLSRTPEIVSLLSGRLAAIYEVSNLLEAIRAKGSHPPPTPFLCVGGTNPWSCSRQPLAIWPRLC